MDRVREDDARITEHRQYRADFASKPPKIEKDRWWEAYSKIFLCTVPRLTQSTAFPGVHFPPGVAIDLEDTMVVDSGSGAQGTLCTFRTWVHAKSAYSQGTWPNL